MTSSDTSEKSWVIVITILVILFIGAIFALSNWGSVMALVGHGESYSTLRLYEFNENVVPQGNSISLTEADFKEFPQLALLIRDKKQKPTRIFDDGTRFFMIPLTSDEMYKFNDHFWSNYSGLENRRLFEYKGKYYEYDYPQIH